LRIDEAGTTNFQQLLVAAEDAAAPADDTVPEEADAAATAVTVGRVVVSDGQSDFTDLALPFPFRTQITELGGEATTLSTASAEASRIALDGRVGEFGLARIEGRITAADPLATTDLGVEFRNVPLPDLSPYTVKFAGRRIADGRLNLDLRYVIEAGRLEGANEIVIDRLRLGEKVDYPGATNLPLGLAVALLKRPDGTIDIDLPVRGDVDDPEFSVGGVVFRAFVNLITKAATSPFRLLGNLVGVQSDDFGTIEFRPGEASLEPPEREKLLKLAEALTLRPELGLRIPPVATAGPDTAALRRARLEAAIEARMGSDDDTGLMLTERRRRALETLAAERLPDEPLEALQDAARVPVDPEQPDAGTRLDVPGYLEALYQRLLETETVDAAALEALAVERAEAVRAAVLGASPADDARVVIDESRRVDPTGRDTVPMELAVAPAEPDQPSSSTSN